MTRPVRFDSEPGTLFRLYSSSRLSDSPVTLHYHPTTVVDIHSRVTTGPPPGLDRQGRPRVETPGAECTGRDSVLRRGDTHGHTPTHMDTHGHTLRHVETHGHTRTHTTDEPGVCNSVRPSYLSRVSRNR